MSKTRERAKKAERETRAEEGVKVDDADHVTIRRQTDNLVDNYKAALRESERIRGLLEAHRALFVVLEERREDNTTIGLLGEVAETLTAAAEAAHPLLGAPVLDPTPVKKSRNPSDPGAATRAARRAEKRLHESLHAALDAWEASKTRSFAPPDRRPTARCRNRACARLDRRVPAWDSHGPNEFCQKCGYRLTAEIVTANIS